MLREITSAGEDSAEPRRRWFSDDAVDLYVWYDDHDTILQFQICYDKGPEEKTLTWSRNGGFVQHTVDDGEGGSFRMKSSPILTDRSHADIANALHLLKSHGAKLEHDLYQFISGKLRADG